MLMRYTKLCFSFNLPIIVRYLQENEVGFKIRAVLISLERTVSKFIVFSYRKG